MTEIEELRQKIDQLESIVMSLMASSGEEESAGAAGAPSAADCDYATPAEFDHEVVWDDQSSKWAVRYSTNTFTYGGKTCEPENLDNGLVPVADGSSVSIYGHAEISLADDGSVSEVSSLTYDTDPTGVTSERPDADDSSSDNTIYHDFLVATIEDSVVYQNLTGALHVGGASASMPTVDDVSIGYVAADDDEDGENDNRELQIKNFDTDESNGSQGLCQRISVVEDGDGYKLSASSSGPTVWILARVNGALKYIPLTGSEGRDPDEEDSNSDSECKNHPGDTDGVSGEDANGGGVGSTNLNRDGDNDQHSGAATGGVDDCRSDGTGESVVSVSGDSEPVKVVDSDDGGGVDATSGGIHSSQCPTCG